MQTQTISTNAGSPRAGNIHDTNYASYLARVQARFTAWALAGATLFETDAEGLWEAYLGAFPDDQRQFHNCNACRRFIEAYGGLVAIAEDGSTQSAVWDELDALEPDDLRAIEAMLRIVRRAKVRGPFLTSSTVLGVPETGVWRHIAVALPSSAVYRGPVLTAGQKMAEKRQDFLNVVRALDEYPAGSVLNALSLLKSDALYRGDKVLGPAQFLADLHAAIAAHPHRRQNVIWRAVGSAPPGFCHPRTSMIGTLLDDIVAGVSFDVASRKFREKMDPTQYQRPQAAPSAGNIAVAEKRFAELGLAPSLKRRFARLEEIQTIWIPDQPKAPAPDGAVFGHLKPRGAAEPRPMTAPPQRITWEKFARTVLPTAASIDVFMWPADDFVALVTSVHPEAPPILKWDHDHCRNPVSWYTYAEGSSPPRWGLRTGSWVKASAVAEMPCMWNNEPHPHTVGVVVLLEGARDQHGDKSGGALFPEILKNELRDIRSTIEAYSKTAALSGLDQSNASGIRVVQGHPQRLQLRVLDRSGITTLHLVDRWD